MKMSFGKLMLLSYVIISCYIESLALGIFAVDPNDIRNIVKNLIA